MPGQMGLEEEREVGNVGLSGLVMTSDMMLETRPSATLHHDVAVTAARDAM